MTFPINIRPSDAAREMVEMTNKAIENISNSVLSELVVTNTIQLSEEARQCERIRQVSIATMLAETIRRIHDEESVSEMYID